VSAALPGTYYYHKGVDPDRPAQQAQCEDVDWILDDIADSSNSARGGQSPTEPPYPNRQQNPLVGLDEESGMTYSASVLSLNSQSRFRSEPGGRFRAERNSLQNGASTIPEDVFPEYPNEPSVDDLLSIRSSFSVSLN
jgi:hypothetical protein